MSIAELKEEIILKIKNSNEVKLLEVQSVLEENQWNEIDSNVFEKLKIGLHQEAMGQTRNIQDFLNEVKPK